MSEQLDINKLLNVSDIPGLTGDNTEIAIYQPLELTKVDSNIEDRAKDLENDYKEVRQNMHYQSQMLFDAAKIFLESAKNADSPRHMEVFAALMGQMTTTNKELLKLHKDMKDITEEKISKAQMKSENEQVFYGSPSKMMQTHGSSFDVTYEKDITDV